MSIFKRLYSIASWCVNYDGRFAAVVKGVFGVMLFIVANWWIVVWALCIRWGFVIGYPLNLLLVLLWFGSVVVAIYVVWKVVAAGDDVEPKCALEETLKA